MFSHRIQNGFTGMLSKAGLQIGDGAKTGFGTAAPNGAGLEFGIDGLAYHKAEAATDVPLTAAAVQGLLSTCLYLVCINSSGTYSTVKGTEQLTADLTNGTKVLDWPTVPAGLCPVGAVKVVTAGSATFTAGTTELDAASVTSTYYDFAAGMPTAPLAS